MTPTASQAPAATAFDARAPRVVRRVLIVTAFVILGVVLTDAAPDRTLRGTMPAFTVLLFLQVAPLLWSPRPDLFSPLVYGSALGTTALISQLAAYFRAGGVDLTLLPHVGTERTIHLSLLVIAHLVLALVAYYAGYSFGPWRWAVRVLPNFAGLRWSRRRMAIVTWLCIAVFLVCYAYFQSRIGGGLFEVTRLGEGKAVWRDDPTLSWMVRGIALGFLPVFLAMAAALPRLPRLGLVLSGFALIVVGLLVTRVGQRGPAVFAMVVGVALFHYLRRRVPVALFFALWFVGVLVANTLGDARKGELDAPTIEQRAGRPMEALAEHADDRDRFGAQAVALEAFPDRIDYLLGESWAGILIAPIPRWLWPEKGDYFQWRDTYIVSRLTGASIPLSLPTVLYVNFSWAGVALGMFLWGGFHRGLYRWMQAAPSDTSVVLFYALMLVHFGPTLIQLSATLQDVVPILVVLKFVGFRPSPAAAPAPA